MTSAPRLLTSRIDQAPTKRGKLYFPRVRLGKSCQVEGRQTKNDRNPYDPAGDVHSAPDSHKSEDSR